MRNKEMIKECLKLNWKKFLVFTIILVCIAISLCLLGGYTYFGLHGTKGEELVEKLNLENTDYIVLRYFEELPPCQRKPSYNLTQKEIIDEILAGIKS